MNVLIKPNQYSKWMYPECASNDRIQDLIKHPQVIRDKDRAPLAIWGDMISDPELDPKSGRPRCTGANVDSIRCLQLDYDSGMTIEQFAEHYAQYRWTLYTSYSYGFKPGDRFRVVIPLATEWPCFLFNSRRVKDNLAFRWGHPDPCCFDRGHFQILPCIRDEKAPYEWRRSTGTELWGPVEDIAEYARWIDEDRAMEESRRKQAQESSGEVDQYQLLLALENELQALPVGCGSRYASVKTLLAKYAHRGLGLMVLNCACPWPTEQKWIRRWASLINWASTLA